MIGNVGQEEPPPDTRSLYLAHPVYRDSASQLVAVPTKVVGPLGLLYVQQREMAVTVPHDSKSTSAPSPFPDIWTFRNTCFLQNPKYLLSFLFAWLTYLTCNLSKERFVSHSKILAKKCCLHSVNCVQNQIYEKTFWKRISLS